MIDLVYVFKAGSKWNDNELRYSLRSAEKHFPHRNVVIVGDRPDWITNVIHIEEPDKFSDINGGRYKNVIKKTRAACNDDRVSKQFVLMNDDFFFLKDTDTIEPFSIGSLDSMIEQFTKTYGGKRNQYINALKRTKRVLRDQNIENPISYAIHYPIVYDKVNFLHMTEEIEWLQKPCSWRTIYGNMFRIGSIEREDPKVNTAKDLESFLQQDDHGDFLSISDQIALDTRFQFWIEMRFPHKSKYEI